MQKSKVLKKIFSILIKKVNINLNQIPGLEEEISFLLSGIDESVPIAVFSSNIKGSFLVPRTLKATAVLFAEPPISSASKKSSDAATPHQPISCPKPIIPLRTKLNVAERKIVPVLNRFSKITTPFYNVRYRLSGIASSIVQKLKLQCLIPKLTRPFESFFKYTRCLLGLNGNSLMKNALPCNVSFCKNPKTERKIITHDRGVPNLDFTIEGQVSTIEDCFSDMEKVVYGARIRVKIVDDESCDDPKYKDICEEAIINNRILSEENCQSQRYV